VVVSEESTILGLCPKATVLAVDERDMKPYFINPSGEKTDQPDFTKYRGRSVGVVRPADAPAERTCVEGCVEC
jgi:hypothetical protein